MSDKKFPSIIQQLTHGPHVNLFVKRSSGILFGRTPHPTSNSSNVRTIFFVLLVEQHDFSSIEVVQFDVAVISKKKLGELYAAQRSGTNRSSMRVWFSSAKPSRQGPERMKNCNKTSTVLTHCGRSLPLGMRAARQ